MKRIHLLVLTTLLAFGSFGQERGLEFLSNVPEFHGLSLKMSEDQLKSHIEKQGLYARSTFQSERITYWVLAPGGENVFVGFVAGKCTGIQRMQPVPKERIEEEIGASEYRAWMAKRKPEREQPDKDRTQWVEGCLKDFESIKAGMTREQVEARLSTDGGFQGVSPVRFAHPACAYFKIDVEFEFKRNTADQNRAIADKVDKVTKVSKPYIERSFAD